MLSKDVTLSLATLSLNLVLSFSTFLRVSHDFLGGNWFFLSGGRGTEEGLSTETFTGFYFQVQQRRPIEPGDLQPNF